MIQQECILDRYHSQSLYHQVKDIPMHAWMNSHLVSQACPQFGSGGDGPTIRFDIITTPNLCHSSFGCMFYNRDKCLAGLSMFHLLTKLCDDQTPVI